MENWLWVPHSSQLGWKGLLAGFDKTLHLVGSISERLQRAGSLCVCGVCVRRYIVYACSWVCCGYTHIFTDTRGWIILIALRPSSLRQSLSVNPELTSRFASGILPESEILWASVPTTVFICCQGLQCMKIALYLVQWVISSFLYSFRTMCVRMWGSHPGLTGTLPPCWLAFIELEGAT